MARDHSFKDDPCAALKAPKSRRRLPSVLSPDEAVQLVAIEGDDALALRDRALLELAYSSGLRVAELSGMNLSMLDLPSGEVRVWGKGSKERIVPSVRRRARRWKRGSQSAFRFRFATRKRFS
jgi:integrase/recombinase XerC